MNRRDNRPTRMVLRQLMEVIRMANVLTIPVSPSVAITISSQTT